jgi:hypothetical protein
MAKRNLTIRVSDEDMEWLKQESELQMRPIANLVLWILQQYRDQKDAIESGAEKEPPLRGGGRGEWDGEAKSEKYFDKALSGRD